jgi:hypothetical protein
LRCWERKHAKLAQSPKGQQPPSPRRQHRPSQTSSGNDAPPRNQQLNDHYRQSLPSQSSKHAHMNGAAHTHENAHPQQQQQPDQHPRHQQAENGTTLHPQKHEHDATSDVIASSVQPGTLTATDHIDKDRNPLARENQKLKTKIIELSTELQRINALYTAMQDKHKQLVHSISNQHLNNSRICVRCHKPIDNNDCSTESSHTCTYHKGEWVLDKQSQEFFSLEPNLRDTLRAEKQKRIQAAIAELNWIADTDDVKDALGKWSCCSTHKYNATGCAQAAQHQLQDAT